MCKQMNTQTSLANQKMRRIILRQSFKVRENIYLHWLVPKPNNGLGWVFWFKHFPHGRN